MGTKYLIVAGPLIFVYLGQLAERALRFRPRTWLRWLIVLLLPATQLAHGGYLTVLHARRGRRITSASLPMDGTPFVLDSVARGVLARIIWHAPPSTPVYAAAQRELLEEPGWMGGLPVSFYFISDLWYSNTFQRRQAILTEFARRGFGVYELKSSVMGYGDCYLVRRAF